MVLSPTAKVGIFVGIGLFFATSGLIVYLIFPRILRTTIEKKLVLTPEAEPYEYWKDVPVPIYMSFYFFNVTNPEEVENGLTPKLEEMGPYVFREARSKVNITWNSNDTVSYKQVRSWFFQPDKTTNGSLDDIITTLNVPMVSAVEQERSMDTEGFDFMKEMVSELFRKTNSTLFVKKPVRQLLFEGYDDMLLETAREVGGFYVPYLKFGWFYKKNNTDDGWYTMFTGAGDIDDYGFIDLWNGSRNLHQWQESPCNEVRGTAGEMWPPFSINEKSKLTFFASDVCRSLSLTFLREVSPGGIPALRFYADNNLFDNGQSDPENKCYCSGTECLPNGVLNVTLCQHGAPAAVSYPHFLWANTSYRTEVSGMRPFENSHMFFMDIEPSLGIPIQVAARMQVNIVIRKSNGILYFDKLTERTVFPIFWFSQEAHINEETASKLRLLTKELPHYVTISSFLLVVIGGVILIFTLIYALKFGKRKTKKGIVYSSVQMKM